MMASLDRSPQAPEALRKLGEGSGGRWERRIVGVSGHGFECYGVEFAGSFDPDLGWEGV